MTGTFKFCLLCVVAAALMQVGNLAQAQWDEVYRRIPFESNSLLTINVDQVLNTPLAAQLGWQEKLQSAFSSHSILLPPSSRRFAIAAHIDISDMSPNWQAAIIELRRPPSMEYVSGVQGSPVESLSGLPAVYSPKGGFILQLDSQRIGVFQPGDRQQAARWATFTRRSSETPAVWPYFKRLIGGSVIEDNQIVFAIDLQDAIPLQFAKTQLSTSESASTQAGLDLDAIAGVLASVQGVSMAIQIDTRLNGKLTAEFAKDPSAIGVLAKPLLLEVLAGHGSTLDELADWSPRFEGNNFVMEGRLGTDSLSHLLGVLTIPSSTVDTAAGADSASSSTEPLPSQIATASLEYFHDVSETIEKLSLRRDAKTLGQRAQWIDSAARKIDGFPVLNVDEDLLNYGAQAAMHLRDMSSSLKGSNVRGSARSKQITGNIYYNGVVTNAAISEDDARRAVQAQEQAVGVLSVTEIGQKINNDTAAIRREMTQRYQMEF